MPDIFFQHTHSAESERNMSAEALSVGIIGVGNISPAYIKGCRAFDNLRLAAVADIDLERAARVAAEHNVPAFHTVDDLLAREDVDIIVNLTIPAVHAEVSLKAIAAGKHIYSEKPLAITLEDGRQILDAAAAAGVRVGCAPDTFLFAQHQMARRLVDEGAIGAPVAAVGFLAGHGPERWHPNPDFFYAPGAGPMLDMGPYYITCLVNLLGPVRRVSGTARASFPTRTAKDGHTIPVNVPTHYTGVLEFESGVSATMLISFDIWGHHLPQMEVYGERGSLTIPDPNGFEPRETRLYVPEVHEWEAIVPTYPAEWARGVGLADMALAIAEGRAHRASGDLAYHVLEVMLAFEKAVTGGTYIELSSTVARPERFPDGLTARSLVQGT
jgi:predicted dehydrogenase